MDLGTADSFAVLAGSTVTNTGPSTINGDLGVSPGTAVTGFPPGTVNGTVHAGDAAAAQAQDDLSAAYTDAAGRPGGASVSGDLGGQTLTPGVYTSGSSAGLTGDLTLNGEGDPNAVFIFQIGSTLTTASGSRVSLINAAQSCNVFWQVGSSATLGTNSTFRGNILALTSITVQTGATVDGRALARNGAVTLDNNTITRAACSTPPGGPTPTPTGSATPAPTGGATPTPTGGATPAPTGGATPTPTGGATPAPTGGATPAPSGGATPAPTSGATPAPTSGATPAPTGGATPAPTGGATPSPTDGTTTGGGTTGGGTTGGDTPQVGRTPSGGSQVGGGSTAGVQNLALLVIGGGFLTAAGVAWTLRRRLLQSGADSTRRP